MGIPLPGAAAVTLTLNVTASPRANGFRDGVRLDWLPSGWMVWPTAGEVLPVQMETPTYIRGGDGVIARGERHVRAGRAAAVILLVEEGSTVVEVNSALAGRPANRCDGRDGRDERRKPVGRQVD